MHWCQARTEVLALLTQNQLLLEASLALHCLGRAKFDPDSISQLKMMVKVNQHNV